MDKIPVDLIITIIVSIMGSQGLWALLQKLSDKKDVRTRMLIGLGHDRITELSMNYIERGYILNDEYENLHDYLYKPYEELGGNGSAKRAMDEVKKLPLYSSHQAAKSHFETSGHY